MERFGMMAGNVSGDVVVSMAPTFHLAYTRECARFHAFQKLNREHHTNQPIYQGAEVIAGQYYKHSGTQLIHKNHTYTVLDAPDTSVTVCSGFDGGQSLPGTELPIALAEIIFDAPNGSTVHAVQGRSIELALHVHEIFHPRVTKKWLYTAVSRARGPGNVRVTGDQFLARSQMTYREKKAWAMAKARSHVRWDKDRNLPTTTSVKALASVLLEGAENGKCAHCPKCGAAFVWAYYSERQPTLDRLDNAIGHAVANVQRTCLKCNRLWGTCARKHQHR
jgi:hypothetical protein